MTHLLKMSRGKLYAGLAFFGALILAITLILTNSNLSMALLPGRATGSEYSFALDNTNAVSSSGDHTHYNKRGYPITFNYSSASAASGKHVHLNSDATLKNTTQITSITSITAVFSTSGTFQFRASYDGATWQEYAQMTSGQKYDLGSMPYFIEFKANGAAADITSINYTYSCDPNPEASGEYVAGETVYQRVTKSNSIVAGDKVLIVGQDSTHSSYYALKAELQATYYTKATAISLSNDKQTATYTSQSLWTVENGSNGSFKFKNGSNYLYGYTSGSYVDLGFTASSSQSGVNWTITINDSNLVTIKNADVTSKDLYINYYYHSSSSTPEFAATKSNPSGEHYLFRETTTEGHYDYDTPVDTIGFNISDSKQTSYLHDEVFDSSNGLTVTGRTNAPTSNTFPISKGGDDGYSYVVKNSSGTAIDTSKAFGAEGTYDVYVSYKNFEPIHYQITVGYHLLLTGIEVNSTNILFNTAQKLSDYTSGITANLTYNNPAYNESNVAYSNFGSKGVTLTLINPSSVVTPITSLFGTAGTWTIKVTSNTNSSVFGTVAITVNAIPVTGISVTGASATVEEESQLQLTASVTPNDATVQTVTWSSNHESIATVNTNGLVTGVSEGEARITATATDGSSVYGYIDITVTAKPVQTDFDADMAAGTSAMACTVDGNEGVKVGTSKASGSMTITVGAGATKLSFYGAGWAGNTSVISLSGATLGTSSFTLEGDTGISGSGSAYSLAGTESDYYCETTLTGVTSQTDITITASTRFAIWKAKYYTTQVDPVYPTSISLDVGSTSVSIGGTTSIDVNYSPSDTNVKNVTFSSNATSVATVSSEGIITGVAVGNARITATAEAANSGTVSAYVDITVTAIAVTGVTVSPASASIAVDATQQLTATIAPSNATNKIVTWTSSVTSVATVSSNGLVTAKAEGTTTITATSAADNTKKGTCTITVTGSGSQQANEETFTITTSDFVSGGYAKNDGSHSKTGSEGTTMSYTTSNVCLQSSAIQFKTNSGYLYNTTALELQSVTIGGIAQGSFTVYGGTSSNPSTAITISGGVYDLTGYTYFKISGGSSTPQCTTITIVTGEAVETDPTSISIEPSSLELAPGGSKTLAVNYNPSNANHNKEVTWTRYSGSSNISVSSSGVVSISSNAIAGNTAVIRATLTNITSIYAQCTVTVVEQTQDDQTILIYLCGSDLESNGQTSASSASGYASGDITEILKVGSQPDDVNVVIETGGAKCWKTTHGINKSYLERYHVANKSLVRDSQETKANMGLTSTLQSFLTWGVQTYPADRISLILWNHGGAMRGVCYDENYSSDCLTNSEVKTAVANTFTSLGRSTSDKFEWIGYDACLMQVQDIAEFNSQYFNYMVASEESEAGAGWDYDNWIDDAYAKKTTPNILKAICDSFLAEQGSSSDQTLSYLDLSYMSAYKSAWETMSSTINSMISSYGKSKFQTLMKTCQYYGSDSDCEGYSYFGILDAKDVVNKIRATSAFSGASAQTSAVLTAFANLVAYSKAGTQAGNSYGLCCFFPMKDGSGYTCSTSSVYTSSQTNFTNWRSIVNSYGD